MPEVLQTRRFIVGDIGPWAFEIDVRSGAIILEADRAADIDLVDSYVAVAIRHRQYGLHLASQAYGFVIATAANWMFKRYVLRHADLAVRAYGDGKCCLTGIRPTDNAPNHQAVFDIKLDGKTSRSCKPRISPIAADNCQAEL